MPTMPTNDETTRYWQFEIGEITTLPPSDETKKFIETLFAPDRFRPAFKRGDAGAATRKGGS